MEPNRPTDLARVLEQHSKDEFESKSWHEQGETIRRLNGRILAHVASLVDSGNISRPALEMLARCSGIAKAWAIVDTDDNDPSKLTDDELAEAAAK